MLFSHRRVMIIYLCLAGMDVAWFTPFWLLFYPNAPQPWLAFGAMLAVLLSWMVVLELLSRTRVTLGRYYLIVLGLMILTSLLAVRVLLFPDRQPLDWRWAMDAVRSFNAARRTPAALLLVLANLFLWQRANSATGRDLTFFGVGVTFRLGMLLLIVSGGLYAHVRGQTLMSLLWLYLGLGLTATALARVNDKAADSQSVGMPLTNGQLAQFFLTVGATVGALVLVSLAYTIGGIRTFFRLFNPIWELLKPLLVGLLLLLARFLEPFFLWLEGQLSRLLARMGQEALGEMPAPPLEGLAPGTDRTPPWIVNVLGQVLIVIVIALGVLLFVTWLLIYLEKVRRQRPREEPQDVTSENLSFGGGILARGVQALRDLTGMVRRFGISGQLLAAVSVQNIYANLCRLASQRGYGRHPAQPPDAYLPRLAQAFGGQEEALARITAAYMRVHYGEHPVTLAELAEIRSDYHQVRQADAEGS